MQLGATQTPPPAIRSTSTTPGQAIVRNITTSVIALAAMASGVYLCLNGQQGTGAVVLGAVVTHYFTGANGQTVTDNLLSAATAVGKLVTPPSGGN